MASKKTELPLNTYGYKEHGACSQLDYDMLAFARRRSPDYGVPPRETLFKRIADKMMPKHFEWHEWTDKTTKVLCNNQIIGLPGCCVSGNTRILDPITGTSPTIKWLYDNEISPIVMTLYGAIKAGVPFIKGKEDLYEIALSDGNKFTATAGHRVLALSYNANRWFHVSDLQIGQHLFSYAPTRQESTLGRAPSSRFLNAPCSQKKAVDFPVDCPTSRRSCDEQLQLAIDASQSSLPSQDDAPTPYYGCPHEDGLETKYKYNHAWSSLGHLSMPDFLSRGSLLDIPRQPRLHQEIASPEFQLFQPFGQSRSRHIPHLPSLELCHNSDYSGFYSYDVAVSQAQIVSIRNTGEQIYYDLQVPDAHHYFAEGCIHHNSGAAKTYNVVGFAVAWWRCDPENSSVTLISTSKQSLRRRGWAEVLRARSSNPEEEPYGNFVDSRMIWQANKGDDKHAIIGKAVEEGPTHKVADDIKGVHTRRQMVIIDEATSVPPAIYEACANLYSYPDEFILVLIGNPLNRLDQFGRFCEPAEGWMSVNVETGEWDGKPQESIGNRIPHIITFDAEKSPNIVEGKIVSRHLPTKEKVNAAQRSAGGQTPLYWQNFRGFWPPEGLVKTIFTQSALEKNDGFGRHKFTGRDFSIIGTFDPARTGDRPALRFAKMGEIEGGKWGLEWMPPKIIPVDSNSTNPIYFQLAEQVKREAERIEHNGVTYSCDPQNFALDATGSGSGCADIFQRLWSPKIIRIEFGGSPSLDSCSLEDVRPANEVYKDKTTEMHFRTRDALNSGQLKGIDKETAIELINRKFDESRKRIQLQSKEEYKQEFKLSPDFGDTGCMMLEVARIRGFRLSPVGQTITKHDEWNEHSNKANSVTNDNDTYQVEEMDEFDLEPMI